MEKNILAVIFVIAFSSVGATAQGVFVPRPPVVYIPQLDNKNYGKGFGI